MKNLIRRYTTCILVTLFLSFLLTACGQTASTSTDTQGQPGTTLTTQSHPTPSPTMAAQLKTYTAQAYTIGYPTAWFVQPAQQDGVTISYPAYKANVFVGYSDGNTLAVLQRVNDVLTQYGNEYKNFHTETAKDNTIGGEVWKQVTWTGINKANGLAFKGIVEAGAHNGKIYILDYSAFADQFDTLATSSFRPMEKSFTFIG